MNSNLYSQRNQLVQSNVVKFRCRLEGGEGQDVHRVFSGAYFPRWRALYLDEMRLVLGNYRVVPIFPFEVYTRDDGSHFMTDDFKVGESVFLGKTKAARDRCARTFVVTEIDVTRLRTPTASESFPPISGSSLPASVAEALGKVRGAFGQKAGGSIELGIKDIGRYFRAVDAHGNRVVSQLQLQKCIADSHVTLSASEVDHIVDSLTREGASSAFDTLISALRGPMSERRKGAVANVFQKLDVNGDGCITMHKIKSCFNAIDHPDVRNGDLTPEQLTIGFLGVWDARDKNGAVTYNEFCDYYSGINFAVDNDDLFEAIVYSTWRILM